ncbi:MAG: ATP-binding protein [Deltaproteobacteria bacterium]|nr:ATP-binding protein [Deltaproteobacteria bacterium]
MYIKRDLEAIIRKYLPTPEILAIIGPRQSGKTTLLKQIVKSLSKAVFLDFEDRDLLSLFNTDIKAFFNIHVKGADYLIIDEFQYAADGGQKLKYLYDTYGIKIIISGSSVLDLTHQAIKYLVGRIFIFHLPVFTFQECLAYREPGLYENVYLDAKEKTDRYMQGKRKTPPKLSEHVGREILKHYHEYAIFGGYPRVVLAEGKKEKITVLKNIYNTYLLREIRDILQLSTENELRKLVKALSLQAGSMIVHNELGQVSSLNFSRLRSHLAILEKTFVIKRLTPFCKNRRTEIAKTPKVYFWDNGFRNMVINNFQPLDERTDRGCLNENFVAGQLLKRGYEVHYWRTKSKAEIDFVIEAQGLNIAIEVKSLLASNKGGRAVFHFREKYPVDRMIVLSENYCFFDRNKDIAFLPVYLV